MDVFISKVLGLIGAVLGWLNEIAIPLFIVVGLFSLIMYGTASDQNKGKWKMALIVLAIVVILFAAVVYIIPWLYNYFTA